MHCYRTVQAECDEHKEKDDCPEHRTGKHGDCLRVDHKHKAGPCREKVRIKMVSGNNTINMRQTEVLVPGWWWVVVRNMMEHDEHLHHK